MTSYLRFLLQFVLFRASPADAPSDVRFLWGTALFATLINFLLDNGHADPLTRALFSAAQVVILGLLIQTLLTFAKHVERWRQTTASLYGASALINLVAWPFFSSGKPATETAPSGIVATAAIFMTVWFVALMARTLHLSMEVRPAFAFLITFLCLMISGVILLSLFPIPVKPS